MFIGKVFKSHLWNWLACFVLLLSLSQLFYSDMILLPPYLSWSQSYSSGVEHWSVTLSNFTNFCCRSICHKFRRNIFMAHTSMYLLLN